MAEFDVNMFKTMEEAVEHLKQMLRDGIGLEKIEKLVDVVGKKFKVSAESVSGFKTELKEVAESIRAFVDHEKNLTIAKSFLQEYLDKASGAATALKSKLGDANMATGAFALKV